jgi:hypothetical protein
MPSCGSWVSLPSPPRWLAGNNKNKHNNRNKEIQG